MRTFFYASLDEHIMVNQDNAYVMSNPGQQSVCIDMDSYSLLVAFVLLFQWVWKLSLSCTFTLQVSFSCFQLLLLLAFTLISIVSLLSLLWQVLLSLSFTYRKCRSHCNNHRLFTCWRHKLVFVVSRGYICENELIIPCRHLSHSFPNF